MEAESCTLSLTKKKFHKRACQVEQKAELLKIRLVVNKKEIKYMFRAK